MARLTRGAREAVVLAFVLAFAAAVAACGSRPPPPGASATPRSAPRADGRRAVSSNVLFEDYAGTQACAACHPLHVTSWLASPMHNMTREAKLAAVRGPWDGAVFPFKGDTARLETVSGERFFTLDAARQRGVFRVTKVVGGHHREDYVGVPVAAARPGAPPLGSEDAEVVLPVSYVFPSDTSPGGLRYKGYSVMVKERPGLRTGPVWRQTCIFCHNTPPYLSTVLGALAGPAAKAYQGQVLDPLLPDHLRASYVVTDGDAMRAALTREITRLGVRPPSAPSPVDAVNATRGAFSERHLVELGIGCEACHYGAAEHVKDPSIVPSFEPRSTFFEVKLPAARAKTSASRHAERVNRACARCHQVLFSGYEHTWEGGARRRGPGGSNINSGEARDMMLGRCASELTCVGCHQPHARDATSALRAMGAAEKDALCTKCHSALASPEALRAHSHHDPAREGARCLSCHMPAKTMSLDGGLTAYHRIGSPTDPERVLLDRPMECALCHADKKVGELAETMETWWNKHLDRPSLVRLYGGLDANVLLATAQRGKPHEQGVAYHALGRARVAGAWPVLAEGLRHPYPLVRGYAKRALDRLAGRPLDVDLDADGPTLERRIQELVARPEAR